MFASLRKRNDAVRQADAARAVEAEMARITAIPFPTARVPERLVEPTRQRSYEEIAASLGFFPAELLHAQLIEFFETEGIKLYNYEQVRHWMLKKAKQAGHPTWCWRPLRQSDATTKRSWSSPERGGYYSGDDWACRPYNSLVPLKTLELVAKIAARFGDRVLFFVADYADPRPDPFIMVRPSGRIDTPSPSAYEEYLLVFDAWDEPGFGEDSDPAGSAVL